MCTQTASTAKAEIKANRLFRRQRQQQIQQSTRRGDSTQHGQDRSGWAGSDRGSPRAGQGQQRDGSSVAGAHSSSWAVEQKDVSSCGCQDSTWSGGTGWRGMADGEEAAAPSEGEKKDAVLPAHRSDYMDKVLYDCRELAPLPLLLN